MSKIKIKSTRSSSSADARRDFDNFDVDEELKRFRRAVRAKDWCVATELATNLDEHLSRGGELPVAWLGPTCMQDPSDVKCRHAETVEAAAKMTHAERQSAIWGYVDCPPAG